jgi:hypothetical protein
MPPTDAIILDNFFPSATEVALRHGIANWATGFASPPKALLPWNGPTSSKLFAAADNGIFDVTANAAIGAAAATITSGLVSWVNFSIIGGNYLVSVNGVDKLQLYNGAAWSAIDGVSVPAITGLATTTLRTVSVSCRRLWFTTTGSLSAWYLPVASIGGALLEFPLGQVFGRGGYLINITTWTIDGGDGSDDLTVFATSEGEVAVYKGTDPDFSTTFSKIGVYYIGEPLGRNCFCKYGGDILYLSQNGLFPLSKALQTASIDRSAALTSKIDPTFTQVASLYSANNGWESIAYPQGSFLLVNIPLSSSLTHQYVMNSITKAWCRFTDWNATSFEVFDSKLFCTTNTAVAVAYSGISDFGAAITGKAQQAYNYFGLQGRQKHVTLVRPIITIDNQITLKLGIDVDFSVTPFTSSVIAAPEAGYVWDTALWDAVTWGPDTVIQRDWASVFASPGYATAFRLQLATASASLTWTATDFVFEIGGVL